MLWCFLWGASFPAPSSFGGVCPPSFCPPSFLLLYGDVAGRFGLNRSIVGFDLDLETQDVLLEDVNGCSALGIL